jgi:hypothetical protein
MGISPNADLNLSDPGSMANFQRALTLQETGSTAQWNAYQGGGGLYQASGGGGDVALSDQGASGSMSLSGAPGGYSTDISGYPVAGVNVDANGNPLPADYGSFESGFPGAGAGAGDLSGVGPLTDTNPALWAPGGGGLDPGSILSGGGLGGSGGGSLVTLSGQAGGVASGGDTQSLTGTQDKKAWNDWGVAAVAQGAAGIGNTVAGAIQSTGSSITTWFSSALDTMGQMFQRGLLGLLAIALIVAALFFMVPRGGPTVQISQ